MLRVEAPATFTEVLRIRRSDHEAIAIEGLQGKVETALGRSHLDFDQFFQQDLLNILPKQTD